MPGTNVAWMVRFIVLRVAYEAVIGSLGLNRSPVFNLEHGEVHCACARDDPISAEMHRGSDRSVDEGEVGCADCRSTHLENGLICTTGLTLWLFFEHFSVFLRCLNKDGEVICANLILSSWLCRYMKLDALERSKSEVMSTRRENAKMR